MKNVYVHNNHVTKELLDTIKVGDLVRVNDWKRPKRVVGVSDNYFLMVTKFFGELWYSVCEKKPWNVIRHNAMRGGMFHCGRDNWIGGVSMGFPSDITNQEQVQAYLDEFERRHTELSVRSAIPIYDLYVKVS